MDQILLENSTDKFFIEYGGFLSNHMSHGLVALNRLGADENRLSKFIRWYEAKLDHKEKYPEDDDSSVVESDIDGLLGKRAKYYSLLRHYEKLLQATYGGDLNQMVAGVFPKLARGMVGSALHGLIHTGYGLVANNAKLVCEGLAYLHFSYLPLRMSADSSPIHMLGQGNMDIADVINMFRLDDDLYNAMNSEYKMDTALVKIHGYFQPRVATLLYNHGDKMAEYINQIKFPEFFSSQSKDLQQLQKLSSWLVDCAITVYFVAENKNDFFLLHGVTGAWSLKNILSSFSDFSAGLEAVQTFLFILFAAYAAEDRPRLCLDRLTSADQSELPSWEGIAERAINTEYDEHVYKLVQVCWDMDKENADSQRSAFYKRAALSSIDNDLFLINKTPRL